MKKRSLLSMNRFIIRSDKTIVYMNFPNMKRSKTYRGKNKSYLHIRGRYNSISSPKEDLLINLNQIKIIEKASSGYGIRFDRDECIYVSQSTGNRLLSILGIIQ